MEGRGGGTRDVSYKYPFIDLVTNTSENYFAYVGPFVFPQYGNIHNQTWCVFCAKSSRDFHHCEAMRTVGFHAERGRNPLPVAHLFTCDLLSRACRVHTNKTDSPRVIRAKQQSRKCD